MSSSAQQYEFTPQQNEQIENMAGKMSFVGLFFAVVGVINLIAALLLVVGIYRHRLPADWVDKAPQEVKTHLNTLPPNNMLWGFAISAGVGGLIYLLIGVWTRSAAASFGKIATTQRSDITNLMEGLGSLHKMYSLIYTLLMIALLAFLIALGISLYQQFMAG